MAALFQSLPLGPCCLLLSVDLTCVSFVRRFRAHLDKPGFRTSLVAQVVKCLSTMRETWVRSLGWEDSPGEGNGNPLQYYCQENPMDRGPWYATVHGVAKSRTRLNDFTYIYPLPFKSPSHAPILPLQVVTEHQAELPVLYSTFPLAVCFTR